MAVITISRQLGSRGEEIARRVSEQFGFTLIDRTGLEEVVLSYGLDERDLPEIQEHPPSLWQRLLSDRKLYLELVESFLIDLSERDNFILLGRGGQCLFRENPDALHVRVVGSEDARVRRLVDVRGLNPEDALKEMRRSDRDQKRFIRYLYDQKIDTPLLYDLTLRTDRMDVEACAQVVVRAVGQRSLTIHDPEAEDVHDWAVPTDNPGSGEDRKPVFANKSEEAFASLLDFYKIRWEYEPRTFPLAWDEAGRVTEAFSPDFYLVDSDTYIELTTLKQSLVTKKNRKLRRLNELYPNVNVRIFYRRDFHSLLKKYGLQGSGS